MEDINTINNWLQPEAKPVLAPTVAPAPATPTNSVDPTAPAGATSTEAASAAANDAPPAQQ